MRNKLFLVLLLVAGMVACEKEVSFETASNSGSSNNGNGSTDSTGNTGNSGNTGNNGSTGSSSLLGTWNFQYVELAGYSETTTQAGGMTAAAKSNFAYHSKQNTGTISFDASGNAISNNLGYAIDTVMNVKSYMDGTLLMESEMPFEVPYFSTSTNTTYKLFGTDSVYFNEGVMTMNIGGSTNPQLSNGYGMKYKIVSNTLTFTYHLVRDSSFTTGGALARVIQNAVGTIVYTK